MVLPLTGTTKHWGTSNFPGKKISSSAETMVLPKSAGSAKNDLFLRREKGYVFIGDVLQKKGSNCQFWAWKMEISRFCLLNVVLEISCHCYLEPFLVFLGQQLGDEEWRALHAVRRPKGSSMFPARQGGFHHFAPNLFRKAQLKTCPMDANVARAHVCWVFIDFLPNPGHKSRCE